MFSRSATYIGRSLMIARPCPNSVSYRWFANPGRNRATMARGDRMPRSMFMTAAVPVTGFDCE